MLIKFFKMLNRNSRLMALFIFVFLLLGLLELLITRSKVARNSLQISTRSFVNQEVWLQKSAYRWTLVSDRGLGQTCSSTAPFTSVIRLGQRVIGVGYEKIEDYHYVFKTSLIAERGKSIWNDVLQRPVSIQSSISDFYPTPISESQFAVFETSFWDSNRAQTVRLLDVNEFYEIRETDSVTRFLQPGIDPMAYVDLRTLSYPGMLAITGSQSDPWLVKAETNRLTSVGLSGRMRHFESTRNYAIDFSNDGQLFVTLEMEGSSLGSSASNPFPPVPWRLSVFSAEYREGILKTVEIESLSGVILNLRSFPFVEPGYSCVKVLSNSQVAVFGHMGAFVFSPNDLTIPEKRKAIEDNVGTFSSRENAPAVDVRREIIESKLGDVWGIESGTRAKSLSEEESLVKLRLLSSE